MSRRVARVAVIGRDAPAWMMALGLARTLAPIGVEVAVVELPSLLTPADAYVTLPSLSVLHDLVGLPEPVLLAATRGVPVLGQRFEGWSPTVRGFTHGYDVQRPAINDVDFLQFWVRARRHGLSVAWEDFSLAAVAARQGRGGGGKDADGPAPGYHLDARAYVQLMRRGAEQAGMERHDGELADVELAGDRIAAVRLADGSRVAADLFVDATGADASLIGALPGSAVEGWGEWFASNCRITASLPAMRPAPAYGQVTAFEDGWVGLHALQDRTALVATFVGDDPPAAIDRMGAAIGVALDRTLEPKRLRCGARPRGWIGNCVAVGDAAAVVEPLDAVALHLVQAALSTLVTFWPVDADAMIEADAYNDAMAAHVARARDFQLAHYRLNGRSEPLWRRAREVPVPAELDARLSLFAARGQMPTFDDETFQPQSWVASFLGHGLMPRAYDPAVDAVPVEEQMAKVQALLHWIAEQVRAMPTVVDMLAARNRPGR